MDLAAHAPPARQTQPAWGAEVLAAFVRRAAADGGRQPVRPDRTASAASPGHGAEITRHRQRRAAEYVDRLLPQLLDVMHTNARPDWQGTELVPDALWGHHIYRRTPVPERQPLRRHGRRARPARRGRSARTRRPCSRGCAPTRTSRPRSCSPAVTRATRPCSRTRPPTGSQRHPAPGASATPTRRLGHPASSSPPSRRTARQPGSTSSSTRSCTTRRRYERTYHGLRARGITELCLLNGIDPARRPDKVDRRLAELRRKFDRDDVAPPQGVTGGVVPPPIPEDRARRMSDRHWLSAMQHYGVSDSINWRNGRLVGDAWTQAQVLETLTKEDPQRFARLLLRIPAGTAEAYVAAILRGLADARVDHDLLLDVAGTPNASAAATRTAGSFASSRRTPPVRSTTSSSRSSPLSRPATPTPHRASPTKSGTAAASTARR